MSYLRSGLYTKPELPAPDSPVGAVIAERRAALVADLGGADACSTAQLALVELALRTWCLVEACDAFLLSLPSIVDKRHRRAWQIVLDRQRLASSLEATLCRLGLERRARDVGQLDVLAELARQASAAPMPGGGGSKNAHEGVPSQGAVVRSPPFSGSAASPDAGTRDEG